MWRLPLADDTWNSDYHFLIAMNPDECGALIENYPGTRLIVLKYCTFQIEKEVTIWKNNGIMTHHKNHDNLRSISL